jgi:hypothetical protein
MQTKRTLGYVVGRFESLVEPSGLTRARSCGRYDFHRMDEKWLEVCVCVCVGNSAIREKRARIGDMDFWLAGASNSRLYVYDIETRRVLLKPRGHADGLSSSESCISTWSEEVSRSLMLDVNAVCFADASSNVVISGSDDTLIKIW